jgi:vacuolar-type H+-ATPase subunit C/Vma6
LLYLLIPEYDIYLIDLFRSKYDFQNFKIITSKVLFECSTTGIAEIGNINPEIIEQSLSDKNILLPEPFNILSTEIFTRKPKNIEQLEIIVEKFKWDYYLTATKHDKFLNELFKTLIDLNNLLVLYQAKFFNSEKTEYFIDGGNITSETFLQLVAKSVENAIEYFKLTQYSFVESITVSELEKSIDNYLIEYLSENSRYSFFSIAPIVNFLYLKEFEAQMLQSIWTGKLNQLNKNYIKANLRKMYV